MPDLVFPIYSPAFEFRDVAGDDYAFALAGPWLIEYGRWPRRQAYAPGVFAITPVADALNVERPPYYLSVDAWQARQRFLKSPAASGAVLNALLTFYGPGRRGRPGDAEKERIPPGSAEAEAVLAGGILSTRGGLQ